MNRIKMLLKTLFLVVLLAAISGCSADSKLRWEESVVLPDGRVVVLKREQHFDEGDYVGAHSFEFQHPVTKQTVKWRSDLMLYASVLPQGVNRQKQPLDGFFSLIALFMVQEVPYILVQPTFANHNEWAGCPYPTTFIYKLNGSEWQQVPYAASPIRELNNNTTIDPKADRDYIKASKYKLAAGMVKVWMDPVESYRHGLYLDKYPTQVFQCPQQKRFDFQ